MKKLYLIVICLYLFVDLFSQLPSSVIFTMDMDLMQRNDEPVFTSKDLPPDLKDSKLFFIQTSALDFTGNCGKDYRFDTTFNNLICSKFKEYPFKFEAFADTFINKSAEYFINNGFKYRLRFYAMWKHNDVSTRGTGSPAVNAQKQCFMICIEDIKTQEIYFKGGYHYKFAFLNKFFREVDGLR